MEKRSSSKKFTLLHTDICEHNCRKVTTLVRNFPDRCSSASISHRLLTIFPVHVNVSLKKKWKYMFVHKQLKNSNQFDLLYLFPSRWIKENCRTVRWSENTCRRHWSLFHVLRAYKEGNNFLQLRDFMIVKRRQRYSDKEEKTVDRFSLNATNIHLRRRGKINEASLNTKT